MVCGPTVPSATRRIGHHGHQSADVGNEAAEQRQQRERQNLWNAQHVQEDGIRARAGRRDDRRASKVAADAIERVPPARIDPLALRLGRDLQQPDPCPFPVNEHEERQEQREDADGDRECGDLNDIAEAGAQPCLGAVAASAS